MWITQQFFLEKFLSYRSMIVGQVIAETIVVVRHVRRIIHCGQLVVDLVQQ